jgi:methylthioribose-1-phosphate isomerase
MARRNDAAADPTRREFFRTFGREAVRNAGAVVGAAAEIRRASGAAARELLDVGVSTDDPADVSTSPEPTSGAAFNSAYRLGVRELLVMDQRDLPGRGSILTLGEPSEVASAIRLGAITGGPILGEIAAYSLALAVANGDALSRAGRDQVFSAAANTLRGARRDVHALAAAVRRMEARYEDVGTGATDVDASTLAHALGAEADAIAAEAQLAHAALGQHGARFLVDRSTRPAAPINLLMHGDMGPLSSGMVGTGTAILQSLVDRGQNVHVWLTEAAPSMQGSRIAALQLMQLDVPHTVIPDTAVSWLTSTRRLDAVLLRGDTVTVAGDTLAPIGSLNVARLAADAEVAVVVVAPSSAWSSDPVDARDLVFNVRSPAETGIRQANPDVPRPAVFGTRLAPTTDIVPSSLVDIFLTDTGPQPTVGS